MAARAADFFRQRNIPYVATREPGGTRIGAAIRAILLPSRAEKVTPLTELLLYAADRAEHVREVILPALEAGKIVLSDRYMDATVAYQGYGRGNDLRFVQTLMTVVTAGVRPDLTLLLDLDVTTAEQRLHRRDSRSENWLDRESLDFHERVRRGYLEIARSEPDRVVVIDASGSVEHTAERVIEVISQRLEQWRSATSASGGPSPETPPARMNTEAPV